MLEQIDMRVQNFVHVKISLSVVLPNTILASLIPASSQASNSSVLQNHWHLHPPKRGQNRPPLLPRPLNHFGLDIRGGGAGRPWHSRGRSSKIALASLASLASASSLCFVCHDGTRDSSQSSSQYITQSKAGVRPM